jgi:hypothetical protein
MSQGELITAYQRGVISRRGFVRGLVSLGATMAFANQLADRVAAAPDQPAAPRAFSSDIYDGGDHHHRNRDRDDEDGDDRDRNDRNQGGGGGGIANLIPVPSPELVVPVIPPAAGPVIATTGEIIRAQVGDIVVESNPPSDDDE